jgi:hypothetical protein
MDTVAQIEAQLVMRNYEGFLGAGFAAARKKGLENYTTKAQRHKGRKVFIKLFLCVLCAFVVKNFNE